MRTSQTSRLTTMALDGRHHRRWYRQAGRDLQALSERESPADPSGWKERFVDILAITSPRVAVVRNIRLALCYSRMRKAHPTTIRGVRAALEHWEDTGEIRGPKTSRFAKALNGDEDAVVLDVWMAFAMRVDQRVFATKSGYERHSRTIRRVAKKLGWTPAETQASIWAAAYRQKRGRWPGMMPFGRAEEASLFGSSPVRRA